MTEPKSTSPPGLASSRSSAAELEARLQQLVLEHMDFVWRSLRRLGVSEADCDDGCQRVWVVMARKLEQIELQKTRSYLFSVVVRIASEMRRAQQRHQHAPLEEDTQGAPTDAEGLLSQKRERAALDRVLETLSFELRTVFVLFEIEGLSSPEIAEALGLPRGTVASRLRLAREAFQRGVLRCLPEASSQVRRTVPASREAKWV